MSEWSKVPVLKTGIPLGIASSNLALSVFALGHRQDYRVVTLKVHDLLVYNLAR